MTKEEIINKYGKYTDSIDITWDKGDIAYILISEGIVDESSSDFKELALEAIHQHPSKYDVFSNAFILRDTLPEKYKQECIATAIQYPYDTFRLLINDEIEDKSMYDKAIQLLISEADLGSNDCMDYLEILLEDDIIEKSSPYYNKILNVLKTHRNF